MNNNQISKSAADEKKDSVQNIANLDTFKKNNSTKIEEKPLIVESTKEDKEATAPAIDGKLFVEANPWAEVFINDKKIDTTPLKNEIELKSGEYELKLVHPEFPPYSEKIEIKPNELNSIKINFYEEVGYLDCKIFPWGEIYINGVHKSTTPLRKPIVLMPGVYNVKITNKNYEKEINEIVTIKAKDSLTLRYNFDEFVKQNNE